MMLFFHQFKMRSRLASSLLFIIVALLTVAHIHGEGQENEEEPGFPGCEDEDDNCPEWASKGECESNPKYMLKNCRRSCNNCLGEREEHPLFGDSFLSYDKESGKDLGVPQQLTFSDETRKQDIYWMINKARSYMRNVAVETVEEELLDLCKNEHEQCAYWALHGECTENPTYMQRTCAPVCTSCEYLSLQTRCPLDPNAVDAWQPGDLNKMFERLTSEPYKSKYEVEILSSPTAATTTKNSSLPPPPWVITMENVVTAEEAIRLIELGYETGYDRSTEVGKLQPDGSFSQVPGEWRTSTNAWCEDECMEDEHAAAVMERIEELTGIPQTNSEHLQLLRYETGQFYKIHHDYIKYQDEMQSGPRILTVFLYLNDVIAGGGTKFDGLDITVMPKRGRAVLWPSVQNNNPSKKDKRTNHQALPVLEGLKYGANAWLHLRDFKTAQANGCTG